MDKGDILLDTYQCLCGDFILRAPIHQQVITIMNFLFNNPRVSSSSLGHTLDRVMIEVSTVSGDNTRVVAKYTV